MIKNGKLSRFTDNVRRDQDSDDQDKPDQKKVRNEVAEVINMIVGGETLNEKRLKRTRKEES